MACIPQNPRRVGYIVSIHGPLDGPLYMGSIYTNTSKLILCEYYLVNLSKFSAFWLWLFMCIAA